MNTTFSSAVVSTYKTNVTESLRYQFCLCLADKQAVELKHLVKLENQFFQTVT